MCTIVEDNVIRVGKLADPTYLLTLALFSREYSLELPARSKNRTFPRVKRRGNPALILSAMFGDPMSLDLLFNWADSIQGRTFWSREYVKTSRREHYSKKAITQLAIWHYHHVTLSNPVPLHPERKVIGNE